MIQTRRSLDRRRAPAIHGMLHTLWTKAVGTKDYVKSQWGALSRWIDEMERRSISRRTAQRRRIIERLDAAHAKRTSADGWSLEAEIATQQKLKEMRGSIYGLCEKCGQPRDIRTTCLDLRPTGDLLLQHRLICPTCEEGEKCGPH